MQDLGEVTKWLEGAVTDERQHEEVARIVGDVTMLRGAALRLLSHLEEYDWNCLGMREVSAGLYATCGGCDDCKMRDRIAALTEAAK